MATLEEYIAQATNAYKPTQNAIQQQIDSLGGKLESTNQQINKNYARQQDTLNRNRNMAAEAASMQAAGSGGSFGGRANLANRAYYEKSFVPAQTQLQTNQANELAQARQANEDEKNNLNSQLANMQAQANQQATNQYWNAIEQDKQRQFEADQAEKARQAQAAQLQKQLDAQMAQFRAQMDYWNKQSAQNQNTNTGASSYKNWDFGNGYALQESNGRAIYTKNGKQISAGNFLAGTGANGINWDLWNDVWNNGVSTDGVGSDTVAAFNYTSPTSSRYSYLF